MLADLLSILGGAALLYAGGEALVAGASRLALRLRVSPLVVGLTVVAFGTSSPELVVSVTAARSGLDDLAVGNVVGSNICNLWLILGISALIRPIAVRLRVVRADVPIMIACSLGAMLMLRDGGIGRGEAAALITGLVLYVVANVWLAARERNGVDAAAVRPFAGLDRLRRLGGVRKVGLEAALVAIGLAVLTGGAHLFVAGATGVARDLGLGEAVIGLTIVAVGTSLPELSTSAVAAARGAGDVAVGNLVGSNVFNILGILGVAGLVHPLRADDIAGLDLWIMLAAAVVLLPLARSGWRITRREGALSLAAYVTYAAWRLMG